MSSRDSIQLVSNQAQFSPDYGWLTVQSTIHFPKLPNNRQNLTFWVNVNNGIARSLVKKWYIHTRCDKL